MKFTDALNAYGHWQQQVAPAVSTDHRRMLASVPELGHLREELEYLRAEHRRLLKSMGRSRYQAA